MADDANADMLKKYTDEWLATPERIRARANLSVTASSAIAAVIGFGTLVAGMGDNFKDETKLTFWFLIGSFVVWVVAAICSLWVLAGNVDYLKDKPDPRKGATVDEMLDFVPVWAENEANVLRTRIRVANWAIGIALLLTVTSIISSVMADAEPDLVEAEVVFDDSVEVPLEEVCEVEFSPVPVRILGPEDLDQASDTVQMEIIDCDGTTRHVTVLWSQVKALVYSPSDS
jgi:hypothetical protein